MFFLGGLNTILPHIIYLSVIWAFLLIGFSSRFRLQVSDKTPGPTVYYSFHSSQESDISQDFHSEATETDPAYRTDFEYHSDFSDFYKPPALLFDPHVTCDYRGPPQS